MNLLTQVILTNFSDNDAEALCLMQKWMFLQQWWSAAWAQSLMRVVPQKNLRIDILTTTFFSAGDPDAVWLMQTWMFLKPWWSPARVKSLVRGVPLGKLVLLDLYAEILPAYQLFDSFYGQPFIWCMLHNFGGNNYLYGSLYRVRESYFF